MGQTSKQKLALDLTPDSKKNQIKSKNNLYWTLAPHHGVHFYFIRKNVFLALFLNPDL